MRAVLLQAVARHEQEASGRLLEGHTWDEMPETREPSARTKLRRAGRPLPVVL
jgi:hypothetical protein